MVITTRIGKSLASIASDAYEESSTQLSYISELCELIEILIDSGEIEEIRFDRAIVARRRGAKKERLLEILRRGI